ncbi:hypothetical protein [Yersinia proxima]|uniref:hypothetical protein n=1 Tax=Yersinia proxima TaxID=2890316 RepID=UPI001D0F84A0|nr:hypothetical protein [Yersinia proxima]
MNIISYLKKFNKKKSPSRISYNYDSAKDWDMYAVYIKNPKTKDDYLFESFDGKKIIAKRLDSHTKVYSIPEELDPYDFNPSSFSGCYYYKASELNFNDLHDLVWWKILKFKFQNKTSGLNNGLSKYLYRRKKQRIKNRMRVLDSLIECYLASDGYHPVNIPLIMTKTFGHLWIYHDDSQLMLKELRLCLDAFVANGDATKIDENKYLPLGKAFITQSEYLESQRRLDESTSLQKKMFLTAFFSFIAAAISAYAALIQAKII